jgi:NAD(P)-dependent dehydrogenase (short-subunit alcohol dehydrogenase family)
VSSGFGRALAEIVLARGDTVIGTLRRPDQVDDFEALAPGRVFTCIVDMTDRERLGSTITSAIEQAGGVDVVVNNAGYGLAGAAEELSDDEIRHQMETNFFGLVTVTQAALPFMRAQGAGHFINISSLAGFSGVPGMSIYSASKFSVEGFSEGLAAEAAHLGIRVTVVEPGQFRTNWSSPSAIIKAKRVIEDYRPTAGQVREGVTAVDGVQPGDPVRAAQAIIRVVESPDPPMHLPLGADAVEYLRNKLNTWSDELAAWESVSLSTAFEE